MTFRLSEFDPVWLHRSSRSRVIHALRFNPPEIDLSFKSQAFEDALARWPGIPQTILRGISPERSREIAEIHSRYAESEQANA
jgi:hypothetical protein